MVVKFDVTTMSARELLDYNLAARRQDVEGIAVYMAKYATEAPKAWGSRTDPNTFADLEYGEFLQVSDAFGEATRQDVPGEELKVEIDTERLRKVKARDFSKRLLMPLQTGDIEKVTQFIAEFVTACPEAWGDPRQPETYLNLSWRGIVVPLARMLNNEASSSKNGSKR